MHINADAYLLPYLITSCCNKLDSKFLPEALAAHAEWVKGKRKMLELKAMFSKSSEQELLQTVREFHTCKQEEGQLLAPIVLKDVGILFDNLERLGQPVGQNLAGKGTGWVMIPNNAPFAPNPKTPPPPKKDNPTKDAVCYQCGEVGHWRRNCPVYLAELIKKKKLSQEASTSGTTGNPSENKVFVARNAEFFESKLLDLKASESVEDLETKFKMEDTNLLSASTDRLCLYIDAEEHELGDLAKGFTQTYGVDYEETFSHVAYIRAIRILIAIAVYYDYEIWQMDVKIAFLNGHLSEEVYMEQPEGYFPGKWREYGNESSAFLATLSAGYLTDAHNLKSQNGYVFILNVRLWPGGHSDSDLHDLFLPISFRAADVGTLTNQHRELDPYLPDYFFTPGWPPLGSSLDFFQFSKIPRGMYYLRFPFLDGATIEQGDALSARDVIISHTTGPLPVNQSLPKKTARLKEVEIPDPKIVAIREKWKSLCGAKKRCRGKTSLLVSEGLLRRVLFDWLHQILLSAKGWLDDAGTAESREDEHVSIPHHDSTNTTHNHTVDHDESFGESRGHGETIETHPADETRLTESPVPAQNPKKTVVQDLVMVACLTLADHADGAESFRPGSVLF
ncbi:zinc finger, CCHC-type containing protein [Tanacetum coccineum]